MKLELEGEICVLGGGPAGSVVAHRLARLGHDVLLVDRAAAKRQPRAESLAPSILPILDTLQLRSDVEAAVFRRERGALVLWESDGISVKSQAFPSLLVERGLLDDRLRHTACRAGVRMFAPASARAVQRLSGGAWLVPVATSLGPVLIRCKFFVDARGRRPHRCLDDGSPRTAALSARWTSGDPASAQTRIEAGRDEWFWGSPLPDRSYAATIFLDSARVAGLHGDVRAEFYRDILSRSRLLGDLLSGVMIGPVDVRDATPRSTTEPIGNDFIRVGDASVSIDPLSSQGIETALVSAIQASAAIHTLLTSSCNPAPALEFYRERQLAAAQGHGLAAARLYQAVPVQSSFWLHRARAARGAPPDDHRHAQTTESPPSDLRVARAARIVEVPVLAGTFIRRAPALSHPRLKQPVAFLGGIPLAPLLHEAIGASTANEILQRWTRRVPLEAAASIMKWMWLLGILVGDSHASRACAQARQVQVNANRQGRARDRVA